MKTNLSRREFFLGSAAASVAAGLWPGRIFADDAAGENGEFEFIQVNDLHFTDEQLCPPWFGKAFGLMRESAPKAEFVLLSGDLTTDCKDMEFSGIKSVLPLLKTPVHLTPGNHDFTTPSGFGVFDRHFPGKRNYAIEHRGWQVFSLNSVESRGYMSTNVPQETLEWVRDNLGKFDPKKPTILSTHFPLGIAHLRRPKNADALLAPFRKFNVQHIFSGHWHGYSEMELNGAPATTNRCCSRYRGNHDGSDRKGWFVCAAKAGTVTRRFVAPPELAGGGK